MIELGADGLASTDQEKFKWVMRGMAAMMTPLTMSMPQGLFLYVFEYGVYASDGQAYLGKITGGGVRIYIRSNDVCSAVLCSTLTYH